MPLSVLGSDATSAEKLFVLALMHHDWDGEKAWPSLTRISRICGLSVTTLKSARSLLEKRGWIVTERRKGRSNYYRLDLPEMSLDQFNAQIKGTSTTQPESDLVENRPGRNPTTTQPESGYPLRIEPGNENQNYFHAPSAPPPSQPPKAATFGKNLAVAAFCEQRKKVSTYRHETYRPSGADLGALKSLWAAGGPPITEAEWLKAMRSFWRAEEKFTGRHSLRALCNNFSRYLGETVKKRRIMAAGEWIEVEG